MEGRSGGEPATWLPVPGQIANYTAKLVVRGGVEPPAFRFSGVADCQLSPVEQECWPVRGRARLALAAGVAVTVAVNETHGLAAASLSGAAAPAG